MSARDRLIAEEASRQNVRSGEATRSTTSTVLVSELLGGLINSAPAGAITLTLPSAQDFVDAGVKPGRAIDCTIENTSGGANAITLAAGSGGTLRGGTSIAQNKSAVIRVWISTTAAYTAHSVIGA